MRSLGVLGHSDYRITALLDHQAMVTVRTGASAYLLYAHCTARAVRVLQQYPALPCGHYPGSAEQELPYRYSSTAAVAAVLQHCCGSPGRVAVVLQHCCGSTGVVAILVMRLPPPL